MELTTLIHTPLLPGEVEIISHNPPRRWLRQLGVSTIALRAHLVALSLTELGVCVARHGISNQVNINVRILIFQRDTCLECGPMPNVMAALPNIGGALCSTPQRLADAHYQSAVQ